MRKVEANPTGGFYKNKGGQSFAEVVKEVHSRVDMHDSKSFMKEEMMEWDERACDTNWLEFSVVGVLKSFSDARLAWVEFRGVPLDCWCEDFFKRLGWAIGEPLLIEEETLNRSNLASGKVLVLIPYKHICPQVIKVVTRRRNFLVSVVEDPKQISYSRILRWLGLDWEETDGDSISGTENCKEMMEGEEMAEKSLTNLCISRKVSGDDLKTTKCREEVYDKEVEKSAGVCLETTPKVNDQNRKLIGKGKGILYRNSKQPIKRPTVFKDALLLENKNGDGWTSSSEESEGDLGCGLIQEKGQGPNNEQIMDYQKSLVEGDIRLLKRTHCETVSDHRHKELGGEAPLENEMSLSHVYATQYPIHANVEKATYEEFTIGKRKSMKSGGKMISSFKRHGMVTRKDRSLEHNASGTASERCPKKILAKGRWNLKDEVTKVIEKGVALGVINVKAGGNGGEVRSVGSNEEKLVNGNLSEEVAKVMEVGVALGFDFNGKEDSVSEEIRRRETEDEARFQQG
ncbi:hypothetical protein Q3G72_011618 [Acer saccharum]|nr:hypothetical protein Q3G72_011618 [Acer saccharum]